MPKIKANANDIMERDGRWPAGQDGRLALRVGKSLITCVEDNAIQLAMRPDDLSFLKSMVEKAKVYGGLTRTQTQYVIGIRGKHGKNPKNFESFLLRYKQQLDALQWTIGADVVQRNDNESLESPPPEPKPKRNPYVPIDLDQKDIDELDEIADKLAQEIEQQLIGIPNDEMPEEVAPIRDAYLQVTGVMQARRYDRKE